MHHQAKCSVRKLIGMILGPWLAASTLAAAQTNGANDQHSQLTIITYGINTSEWNAKLHLSAIRFACKENPETCMRYMEVHARNQNVNRFFLNVFLDERSSQTYGVDYSRLSLQHPALYEVGIDDFVSVYYHLTKRNDIGDPAQFLRTFVNGIKSTNPRLKFGVTVYEDELSKPFLQEKVPPDIRARIDDVHLYLHYRANGPAYVNYVQLAKKMFPHASVIAGAYALDRIDYLPCTIGGPPCSSQDELELFEKALEIQADLLKQGAVVAIEFFPGDFGQEQEWPGWNNPRVCRPGRKQECIEDTKMMRQEALRVMRSKEVVH